ncbi:MAG: pectate lyase [Prevotella sp.]|nr:pectate lyase [Prevotella sp.]MBR3110673.1 pectate lyase [Prevotella sp.]
MAVGTLTAIAQEEIPAFPGAEGHGRYITGGRGGEIRHVTNLNDSGAGSLREALKGNDAKTIVFDVSGYIDLKSQLDITSNTTIAGQTAPYPGITLRYFTIYFGKCDNVIVRFLRFRRSQVKDVNDGADATWGRKRNQIMLDHCSFSWSIDEVASFYDNNNFTMQWCTVSESLTNPGHSKGAHGYGGIWGGKLASFHHNLIAHVTNRAPRFNGARYQWDGYKTNMYYDQYQWENYVQAENVDLRNCVMYNYQSGSACYGGPGGGYINIVNNYYKAGPSNSSNKTVTKVTVGASGNSTPEELTGMTSRYFINGNYVTAAGSGKEANYDWKGVDYDGGTILVDGERYSKDPNHMYGSNVTYAERDGVDYVKIKLDEPCPAGDVTTHTAENTYEKVLAYGGASLYRDDVDSRNMEEVRTGTAVYTGPVTKKPGQLDFINDPEGEQSESYPSFPKLSSENRAVDYDSDGDGMPDEWESANGLNPNDAADGNAYTLDTEKGWYTNVEVYMNSIVEDIMKGGNADAETTVNEYYPTCVKTAIRPLKPTSNILKTEYYSLEGFKLDAPRKGVTIRVERMTDGSKTVTKVYQ